MKTNLTPEQSQRLIELGVDPSKASMCRIQHEADGETIYRIVEHDEFCYEMPCLRPKPIFDLTDILSLLPKQIDGAWLSMYCLKINEWTACYEECDKYGDIGVHKDSYRIATELIDALYKLLVWVLKKSPRQNQTLMNGIIIKGKVYEAAPRGNYHCSDCDLYMLCINSDCCASFGRAIFRFSQELTDKIKSNEPTD